MSRKFRAFMALAVMMLVVSIGINISQAVTNSTAEPGSDQDPLISKSYVDQVVGQLTQKLLDMQGQLDQMKKDNDGLVQKLNAQDAAVKALQEELKTVKSQAGAPASSVSTTTPSTGDPAVLKGTVTASALNVRSQTNTNASIVAKVYKGEVVTVVSKGGLWSSIKTAKGVAGFVQTQYLSIK